MSAHLQDADFIAASELQAYLDSRGVTLELEGGRLSYRPKRAVGTQDLTALRKYKEPLLTLLRSAERNRINAAWVGRPLLHPSTATLVGISELHKRFKLGDFDGVELDTPNGYIPDLGATLDRYFSRTPLSGEEERRLINIAALLDDDTSEGI